MDKIHYFYKTTNLINSKYYYGSGSSIKPYFGSGVNIIRAVKKYGIDNFKTDRLRFFETREDAYLFEGRFLKLYKISEDKNSYNIKNSGTGGDTFTNNPNKESIRNKQSIIHKEILKDPERRSLCNSFRNLTEDELIERTKIWSDAAKGSKNGRYKYDQKVGQYDKEGNLIKIWDDCCEASTSTGISHKYILGRCKTENNKTYKGFIWKFVE